MLPVLGPVFAVLGPVFVGLGPVFVVRGSVAAVTAGLMGRSSNMSEKEGTLLVGVHPA